MEKTDKFSQTDFKIIKRKIDTLVYQISLKRDELRDLQSDLSEILESVDGGIESISEGMMEIECGIDQLSELL